MMQLEKGAGYRGSGYVWTKAAEKKFIQMWENGDGVIDIADFFGVSDPLISRKRASLHLSPRYKRPENRPIDANPKPVAPPVVLTYAAPRSHTLLRAVRERREAISANARNMSIERAAQIRAGRIK